MFTCRSPGDIGEDAGGASVAIAVNVDVERLDDGVVFLAAPVLGQIEPHHLELEPVGIAAVQALVDVVVRRADQRAGGVEAIAHLGEFVEGGDFPREVVHADRPTTGLGITGCVTDGEERDVVVVRRARRPHEHERTGAVDHGLESEQIGIEVPMTLGVANVQDGVVELSDRHPHSLSGLMVRP